MQESAPSSPDAASDNVTGGHAITNDATALAADRGFKNLASVTELRLEYIAPSS